MCNVCNDCENLGKRLCATIIRSVLPSHALGAEGTEVGSTMVRSFAMIFLTMCKTSETANIIIQRQLVVLE